MTPWTAALQASLSIANSWSPPKLMSIESVMPPNHLILCRPLLLLPSIFPSIRVFSNESVMANWSLHAHSHTPHCTADTRVMNLAGPALVSGNFPSSSSNCTIRSVPSATKGITRGALEDIKGGLTLTTWCVCVCERRLIRPALLTLEVW